MPAEMAGYIILDDGVGSLNGMSYETQTTAATFTDDFTAFEFGHHYTSAPVFLASLVPYNGIDNAHLRFQNLDSTGVERKIGEYTTKDPETIHSAAESISYLLIGGQNELTAISAPLADVATQEFTMNINDAGWVNDLNVTLDILHTKTADLDVSLAAPDGTTVELFGGVGGDSDHFTATTLNDEAVHLITLASRPFSGRFQGESNLADFRGKWITDTWKLKITDNAAIRMVKLRSADGPCCATRQRTVDPTLRNSQS